MSNIIKILLTKEDTLNNNNLVTMVPHNNILTMYSKIEDILKTKSLRIIDNLPISKTIERLI